MLHAQEQWAGKLRGSIGLSGVAIGADDRCGFAGRAKPKLPDLSQDISRRGAAILSNRGFNDRHLLYFERPMMPFRTVPQALEHVVRRVLD